MNSRPIAVLTFALQALCVSACRERQVVRRGDLSLTGGSPTIRREFTPRPDDPATTNDESNDQPRGFFGTTTLQVTNLGSGNSYPLDADLDGTTLHRLYFPKGGWIDFPDCELEPDLTGTCDDEEGRSWEIGGAAGGSASGFEEEVQDEGESPDDSDEEADERDDEESDQPPGEGSSSLDLTIWKVPGPGPGTPLPSEGLVVGAVRQGRRIGRPPNLRRTRPKMGISRPP